MKKIGIIWLVAGAALLIWCLIGMWQIWTNLGINSGPFLATLIGLCFSILCVIGARGLILKKTWGRKIIISVSCVSVFYSAVFLLGGGFEDTSRIYAIAVLALFLLGIINLVIIRKEKFTEWQLNTYKADRD